MALIPFEQHHPFVDDSAFIAPGASVIGRVRIAAEVSIMFGAVIRGDREDIQVGAGSNLQDNAVIHSDPGFPVSIGRGVSIGHVACVHGATIDDDVIVGMGATVLNGARIGAGSIIAAGAVVKEGQVIPPGSLVAGVPGQVRRETTDEERSHIQANAQTYRDLGRSYLAG